MVAHVAEVNSDATSMEVHVPETSPGPLSVVLVLLQAAYGKLNSCILSVRKLGEKNLVRKQSRRLQPVVDLKG